MAIKQQIKFKDEINFEADQQDSMKKTNNIQSLADQVERLESLNARLVLQEDNMKSTKKDIERLSGEVIPTMMTEMGFSELTLKDNTKLKKIFSLTMKKIIILQNSKIQNLLEKECKQWIRSNNMLVNISLNNGYKRIFFFLMMMKSKEWIVK